MLSSFRYYPLIWILGGKMSNSLIVRVIIGRSGQYTIHR